MRNPFLTALWVEFIVVASAYLVIDKALTRRQARERSHLLWGSLFRLADLIDGALRSHLTRWLDELRGYSDDDQWAGPRTTEDGDVDRIDREFRRLEPMLAVHTDLLPLVNALEACIRSLRELSEDRPTTPNKLIAPEFFEFDVMQVDSATHRFAEVQTLLGRIPVDDDERESWSGCGRFWDQSYNGQLWLAAAFRAEAARQAAITRRRTER